MTRLLDNISNLWQKKAEVTEIFSSIQGEGIFLGARQIFVRFKRCNMKCVFCDEPREAEAKNYSPLELITEVRFLEASKGIHHSVSLTGGEPLLYLEFLKGFLKMLSREGMKSYLETNGTLPSELSDIIDQVDIVAMDFKLPSSTKDRPYWDEHAEFLSIARRKKTFVKAVITPDTTADDIVRAAELINRIDANMPFILQPATPIRGSAPGVDNNRLLEFLEVASKNNLTSVRVIPQVHKMLNVK